MNGIFIKSNKPEDWQALLAEPAKQWKTGYSAKTLAYCWQESEGFPSSVQNAFNNSGIPLFKDIRMLFAFPEYKVPLPGGSRPSQNDIFVVAKSGNEIVSITVEGKVSEPFGNTVEDWIKGAANDNGKIVRLNYLKGKLCLESKTKLESIRYQLLHRTVSAIIKAEELNASKALMLVHSFSQTDQWFDDYVAFVKLFNLNGKKDSVVGPAIINGLELYFGWSRGEDKYLSY